MGFMDSASKKNTSREGRGHTSGKQAAKDRLAASKPGRKVSSAREKTERISESAKQAVGKDGRCAECGKGTKNNWVCSAACAKKAGHKF